MLKLMRSSVLVIIIVFAAVFSSCAVPNSGNVTSAGFSDISFKNYANAVLTDRMYKDLLFLAGKDDARVTGFDGEEDAADYIFARLQSLKLATGMQEFPVTVYKNHGTGIKVNHPEEKVIQSGSLTFSTSTPKEGLTTRVVYAGTGAPGNYSDLDVKEKIVLIERGGEPFFMKADRAASMGAAAVIFYDPASEALISATLVKPSSIPAVIVGKLDGEYLKSLAATGEDLDVTLKVDAEFKEGTSRNVAATLKAAKKGKDIKTVIIGAHMDGVDTPAANDNASGVVVLLEAARLLSKEKLACDVRFVCFGAEEIGLVGSRNYLASLSKEEKENTLAMINMDMVGTGDTLSINTFLPEARSFAADLAEACARKLGYVYKRDAHGNSDHEVFEKSGIPVAYFEYGPYNVYHTDDDTVEKVKKENLARVCNVVAAVTREIANHPEKYGNK